MSNKPRIYLAGPINKLDFESATKWRQYVMDELGDEIDCFSPMRAKSYLRSVGTIFDSYENHPLSCQRGIMTRDYTDCTRADLLFVNFLGATHSSPGTAMEIAWAYMQEIPIVCAIEDKGNPYDHPMIREAIGFRVNNLRDAIITTRIVLFPVGHEATPDVMISNYE